MIFHTTNLTTAIDITSCRTVADGSVTDADMCTLVGSCIRAVIRIDFTHHAFLALEGVVITLAATIYITADSDMLGSF